MRAVPHLTIAVVLFAGCEAPPLRAESEHFRFFSDDPSFFSENAIADYEQHYASVAPWIGIELAAGHTIDVYQWPSVDAVTSACGRPASGCAPDDMVYIHQHIPHELIHAYTWQIGEPPRLFAEGIANVLGSGIVWHEPIETAPDIRTLLESAPFIAQEPTSQLYGQAASFVRSLIDRHGSDAFWRFYATTDFHATLAEIDAAFVEVLGESLDAAIEAWVTGPPQTYESVALRIAECAAPLLTSEVVLECGMTLPGSDLHDQAVARARIAVPPDGAAIAWDSSDYLLLHVGACPSSPSQATDTTIYSGPGRGELFWGGPPGDAWLYAGGSAYGDGSTGRISSIAPGRQGPLVGERCNDAPVHELAPELVRLSIHGPLEGRADDEPADGLADVVVRFRVAGPRTMTIGPYPYWETYDGVRVALCSTGCNGCLEGDLLLGIAPFDPQPLEPGRTYAMIISGVPAGRGYHVDLTFEP